MSYSTKEKKQKSKHSHLISWLGSKTFP
jgi:hypothetical protein